MEDIQLRRKKVKRTRGEWCSYIWQVVSYPMVAAIFVPSNSLSFETLSLHSFTILPGFQTDLRILLMETEEQKYVVLGMYLIIVNLSNWEDRLEQR